MSSFPRATLVVLTHNRKAQLLQALRGLGHLKMGWPVIVVDNGSSDGTCDAVREEFPSLLLIRSRRNIGVAARNIAVAYVHTPYIAFCDDNVKWTAESLRRAVEVLDRFPRVGVVAGPVLMGMSDRIDPAYQSVMRGALKLDGMPGVQLSDFMGGACVARTRAFYEAGGYWPPLFSGGEEALLTLDLAQKGWIVLHVDEVVARRWPVSQPVAGAMERQLLRNAIWLAWMRLPLRQACEETRTLLHTAARRRQLGRLVVETGFGMARVLRARKVVTPAVAAMHARRFGQAPELIGKIPSMHSGWS